LDRWFKGVFNVTIHLDVAIKREILRFRLAEDRRVRKENEEEVEGKLRREKDDVSNSQKEQ